MDRAAARLLRIPRRADGAVGRPRRRRLHRRPADRRHARPQRPAPGPLPRHRRRPGGDGVGVPACCRSRKRGSSASGGCSRARCCWSTSNRAASSRTTRSRAISPPRIPTPNGWSGRRSCWRTCSPSSRARRAPTCRCSIASRRSATRRRTSRSSCAHGLDRRGGDRLDGDGHADLGALRQVEAALHLLQAELRPGDEPADRPDPRGARHEPRLVHRAAAQHARPQGQLEAQAARGAPADPHQRGSREDPLDRRLRGCLRHEDARHHLRRPERGGRHVAALDRLCGRADRRSRAATTSSSCPTGSSGPTASRSRRCSRRRPCTII